MVNTTTVIGFDEVNKNHEWISYENWFSPRCVLWFYSTRDKLMHYFSSCVL